MSANYQLIAFDMDGTLLDSSKRVLPSSTEAIAKAVAEGKDVAICTGRCPRMVEPYLGELVGVRYAICCSGAIVYDHAEDRALAESPMDASSVDAVFDLIHGDDYFSELLCGKGFFYDETRIDRLEDFHVEVYRSIYQSTGDPTHEMEALAHAHRQPCVKLSLHFTSAEIRNERRAEMEAAGLALELVNSETSSLEVSARDVSKGTGLAALAERLGVDVASTIAVGDSDNDVEALRTAGLGLAMGNATPAARAAADAVVATSDEGGCAEAIERYLLAG